MASATSSARPPAPQRDQSLDVGADARIRRGSLGERRLDRPRRDGVDADTPGHEVR